MSEATPRPWMWAWRDDEDAPASIFSMVREGHAYAVAMCPRYQKGPQWVADAKLIVEAVNNYDTALTRIRELELRLGDSLNWLEGCLKCNNWNWDGMQRSAAEIVLNDGRAALAGKDQEKTNG